MEQTEYITTSQLRMATVFLQGAELVRETTVKLHSCRNVLCVNGLPEDVHPESITVQAGNGAQLISAAFRVNHMEKSGATERVKDMEKQLELLEDQIRGCDDALWIIDGEADFLRRNQKIGGKHGIQLDNLRIISDYYRERMAELANMKFSQEKLKKDLQENHRGLNGNLENVAILATKVRARSLLSCLLRKAQAQDSPMAVQTPLMSVLSCLTMCIVPSGVRSMRLE
jgi:hypothetical protein